MRLFRVVGLSLGLVTLAAVPAFAEPGRDRDRSERRDDRDGRDKDRDRRDDQGRDNRDRGGDRDRKEPQGKGPGAAADKVRHVVPAAVKAMRDNLDRDRDVRRDNHRKEVQTRYGAIAHKPVVREELALHAKRVAQLDYLTQLATSQNKTQLVQRIATLRAREDARHTKRMDECVRNGGER